MKCLMTKIFKGILNNRTVPLTVCIMRYYVQADDRREVNMEVIVLKNDRC